MTDKSTEDNGSNPQLTLVERGPCIDNLGSFIKEAKALTVFGPDLDWHQWRWAGVGTFTAQGAMKGGRKKIIAPDQLLHPDFIDFAKACIRYRESENPSQSNRKSELCALRLVERALRQEGAGGDPTRISLHTLDLATQLVRETSDSQGTRYNLGTALARLAKLLNRKGLTRNSVGSFSNPIEPDNSLHLRLGDDADRHRQSRLPDERALACAGAVFAEITEPEHPESHRDVFVTSCVTLLLSGSKRGNELFEMETDALYSELDSDRIERWGFRWRSSKSKNKAMRISWIHEVMEPHAREAFRRIYAITEEPRRFARYCEEQLALREINPNDPGLRFYRHALCPDVPDNQPLTNLEVLAALGSESTNPDILSSKGLSRQSDTYTLDSLWQWVMNRLPPGFPYVKGAKNKHLKYSEALFCMHPFQLKTGAKSTTNPLSVWMPSLDTLTHLLRGRQNSPSFFERHRAEDEDGNPLRLKSHQIRHLLDTISHEGTGDDFLDVAFINAFAGRAKAWQGRTYDHSRAEDKAEIDRSATQQADGRSALFDLPGPLTTETQTKHWSVRLKPRSTADIEMHYRSATVATVWGGCEHDWLLKPCPYNRDCLNCKSHVCIKGFGQDDQERLQRLKMLLDKIVVQQGLAQAALDRGEPGTNFWLEYQTLYRERVEELIRLLEDPNTADGAEIRLTNATANTHLHRVLQQKVLLAVESQLDERDAVNYLLAAYQENRALPLETTIPLLEHHHGA